jgi:hypothetical protein
MEAGKRLEPLQLDSKALAWVYYRPEQRVLQVGLRTGRDYEYFAVPAEVYRDLLAAESKGRYYNHHIRNEFDYKEIRR